MLFHCSQKTVIGAAVSRNNDVHFNWKFFMLFHAEFWTTGEAEWSKNTLS